MSRTHLILVRSTSRDPRPVVAPEAPQTAEETGLSADLLVRLVLKTLYFTGELTGTEIAKRLGVAFAVVEPSLEFLKTQRHCEVVGGALIGTASYRYRVTTEGRSIGAHYLQQDQYIGTAPVPLEQYRTYMQALRSSERSPVTRDEVRDAFSHLVLSDDVLDEIGPAVNRAHSIFIYGPSGNGKTAIAHAIRNLLAGDIAIPRAIEVEGSIIRMYDPVSHEERPMPDENEGLETTLSIDRRWVMCRRPMLAVGGEMNLDSLELNYSARLGFYRAPLQLMANGGVLLIDDFGRQRSSPSELLNRWMVPLESGIDYLTLQSGAKFDVPFVLFLVFATNLKPSELVDEAFLRRVSFKVCAQDPTREDFMRIFERCCEEREIPFDRRIVDYLLDVFYTPRRLPLRACHPRDLITQALLLADYRGQPHRLTVELLETACKAYFVDEPQ